MAKRVIGCRGLNVDHMDGKELGKGMVANRIGSGV